MQGEISLCGAHRLVIRAGQKISLAEILCPQLRCTKCEEEKLFLTMVFKNT